jgi:hypothetical protein
MMPVLAKELEILSGECVTVLEKLISSSVASRGDLAKAEEAMMRAISEFRSIVVTGSTRACVTSADRNYQCPTCGSGLTRWGTTLRSVVTCAGEGTFPSERYRCRHCGSDFYPWQTAHGLDEGQQYTLSARQLIAEEAACGAYDEAAVRLNRMGLNVSPSEVDRTACEVGTWCKQEQEVVRFHNAQGDRLLSIPLQDWSSWPANTLPDDVVVVSVDGAKVRSIEIGPKGLEWFEVRSGIIGLSREDCLVSKVCVGGVMEADQLFETLRSQWWQAPQVLHRKELRTIFIADGAEWIWNRAGWHFPRCIQILDIYHAAQHVGAAARAAWGADDPHAKRWVEKAIPWLLEASGAKQILRAVIGVLRSGRAQDPEQLRTELQYLWRHRHRMKYRLWKDQNLPIGSGAMESTIKQVCTRRLRMPGMKWTRDNADLIMHLRSAVISNALHLTLERERRIRANRAAKYYRNGRSLARAV